MQSRYKYLLKNTSLLMIGNMGAKIVSFILIPFYTSILSTTEYGIFDVLVTTESLLIPILTLDIGDAVFRFSMDEMGKKKDEIISNGSIVWTIGSTIALLLTMVICLVSNPIYCWFVFFTYIVHSVNSIFMNYVKAIDKVRLIAINGILNAFIFGICSILFLVVFHMGLNGYLAAYTIGFLIPDFVLLFFLRNDLNIQIKLFDKQLLKEMLKYSIPLIVASIGWWIISASDRYMVSWISGPDQNGIYSIAYKMPNILVSLMTLFSQAWVISVIKEDDPRFHIKMYRFSYSFLSLLCIILITGSEIIGRILYSKEFYTAWRIAPWLLIASVFQGLSTFYCNILTGKKDPNGITIASIAGAIINILLNTILIPFLGSVGAAYATVAAYIIVWLVLYIRVYKITNVRYFEYKEIVNYMLLFVCASSILGDITIGYVIGFLAIMLLLYENRDYITNMIKRIKIRK